MRLSLQPTRVATGLDEEGLLIFDNDQRLVAVLTRLSDQHEELSGHWFLEVGFGRINSRNHPTFADIDAAQDWIAERLEPAPLSRPTSA